MSARTGVMRARSTIGLHVILLGVARSEAMDHAPDRLAGRAWPEAPQGRRVRTVPRVGAGREPVQRRLLSALDSSRRPWARALQPRPGPLRWASACSRPLP